MPRKYTIRSKEEKLAIVKRNLSGEAAKVLAREIGCNDKQVRDWVKIRQKEKLVWNPRRNLAILCPDMNGERS